jgi:hypothetical protein
MRKWIVFKAIDDDLGWENRSFSHTGSLTDILAEHFDSSDSDIPKVGYRPPEFIRVEQLIDPQFPEARTHYRHSNWEVTKVETYTPDIPMGEFDMIVICHCKYSPINTPLKPMPERQVSLDSFGGDEQAYKQWMEQNHAAQVKSSA